MLSTLPVPYRRSQWESARPPSGRPFNFGTKLLTKANYQRLAIIVGVVTIWQVIVSPFVVT